MTDDGTGVRRRHGRTALAAVVIASVALLPGCGGDDKPAASASASASSDAADVKAVRDAYTRFEQAGAKGDTAAVVSLVSSSTTAYFDKIRDLALEADKATLAKERVVDQITVLGMRAKVPAKVLRTGSTTDLLKASSAAGAAAAAPAATGLAAKAKITVNGDTATAVDPANPAAKVTFVKEGGAWKADVTGVFDQLEQQVQGMVQQAGGNPTAFVEQAVAGQVGGAAKAKALWTPIGR